MKADFTKNDRVEAEVDELQSAHMRGAAFI